MNNDLSKVKIGDTLYSYQYGEVEVLSTCQSEFWPISCNSIDNNTNESFTDTGIMYPSHNHPDLFLSHAHMIEYMKSLKPQQAIIVDLSKVKVGDSVWHWSHGDMIIEYITNNARFPFVCKSVEYDNGYYHRCTVNKSGHCLEFATNPIIFENVYQYNDYKNTECNK